MKKILIICCFTVAFGGNLKAQGFQSYTNNTTFQTKDFSDVKGNPYTSPEWAKGTVVTSDNKTYTNLDVKYSDYEDKLIVKGPNDQLMEFGDLVNDFTLSFTKDGVPVIEHYHSGYANIPGYNKKDFFEVLTDGKAQLLKKTTKKIQTINEYGSVTSNKSFMVTHKYFLLLGDKAVAIKRDKKSLLAALPDKQPQLEDFVKTNNLSFKTDEDLIKVVSYYNTL